MESVEFSPAVIALLAIAAALFGVLANHRLSLHREQRKEFNELAAPIREKLVNEASSLAPYVSGVSLEEWTILGHYLKNADRIASSAAFSEYWAAKGARRNDAYGQVYYEDPERLKACIDRLLRYVGPR